MFAPTRKRHELKAVDLYSGVGGWSLGLRMAGIDVVASYEWWPFANLTNSKNNGHSTVEMDIRSMDPSSVPKVDVVVGSPPCTHFSLANRGGKGDILEGLKDVEKFLEVVDRVRPSFWALENVPRLAAIFQREMNQGGVLHRFAHLDPFVSVLDASEWGAPQRRKRAIIGRFDLDLLLSYRALAAPRTLGDVLSALSAEPPRDPLYGLVMRPGDLTETAREEPLSSEEIRLNGDAKANHPVYNGMKFPDDPSRPSRTVTATCTRVSRESIVVPDGEGFRRLTLRERACLQSFPATYQFYAPSNSLKQKMVGNAVPPLLTYHIAHAMMGTSTADLLKPRDSFAAFVLPVDAAPATKPDRPSRSYPADRRFKACVPGLRFKSGMRFELSNSFHKGGASWRVRFFYGGSGKVREVVLDGKLLANARKFFGSGSPESNALNAIVESGGVVDSLDPNALQRVWSGREEKGPHPHALADSVGRAAALFVERDDGSFSDGFVSSLMESEGNPPGHAKVLRNAKAVFAGLVVGSLVNTHLAEAERNGKRKAVPN